MRSKLCVLNLRYGSLSLVDTYFVHHILGQELFISIFILNFFIVFITPPEGTLYNKLEVELQQVIWSNVSCELPGNIKTISQSWNSIWASIYIQRFEFKGKFRDQIFIFWVILKWPSAHIKMLLPQFGRQFKEPK